MVPVSQRVLSPDLVVLLGAGASVEAGVPASAQMISRLEELLEKKGGDFVKFRALYHQIKSGILYGAGIQGRFGASAGYNIEILVNTLYELERNEEHPIYPFIGSWNPRLLDHAGSNFSAVREFRRGIVKQLQGWVQPAKNNQGRYYEGIRKLQKELGHPLRLFSLNYDRMVESLASPEFLVEGGFGPQRESKWEWVRFEEVAAGTEKADLFLYKLHGSIDWRRDNHGDLMQVDYAGEDGEELQIIFGREFKLEAADPYLLYAYEFRRLTMEARLVIVVGYSFADDHINKMLRQAFRLDSNRRLLAVDRCDEAEIPARVAAVAERVGVEASRITLLGKGAKRFLEADDIFATVQAALPAGPTEDF